MNIRFKNVETDYKVKTLAEQKIKTAEDVGWMLIATIEGNFNSDSIDKLLIPENIKEITIINVSIEDTTTETKISGYDKVSSCTIRHRDTTDILEIQLTKGV